MRSLILLVLASVVWIGAGLAHGFIAAPKWRVARVGNVLPGSPAQRAGLERGDGIIYIDNQAVVERGDLPRLLNGKRKVVLSVQDVRSGRLVQVEAFPVNGQLGIIYWIEEAGPDGIWRVVR
jgi:S1-C subfamily serine protease